MAIGFRSQVPAGVDGIGWKLRMDGSSIDRPEPRRLTRQGFEQVA
jgi:hypothetical protein